MDNVALLASKDRAALFGETGAARGVADTIIENDFWVCWTLKRLFVPQGEKFASLVVKGGTSLSKAYGAIRRFSEDIDLSLDRADLSDTGDRDPEKEGLSKKKAVVGVALVFALLVAGCADEVERAINRLDDKDQAKQAAAIRDLAAYADPRAVPALIAYLRDTQRPARSSAVRALGALRDARAVPALVDALADANEFVALEATDAMASIGPPAVEPLIAALASPQAQTRRLALSALGKLADERSTAPVLALCRDADPQVRGAAVLALRRLSAPEVTAALLVALADPKADVRRAAAQGLAQRESPTVARALVAALADADRDVRSSARIALATIGAAAVPPLLERLGDPRAAVRETAAELLQGRQDPPLLAGLLRLLAAGRPEERVAAAKALLGRRDPPVVEPLIDALANGPPELRVAAARALFRLDDPRAAQALDAALAQRDLAAVAGAYVRVLQRRSPDAEALVLAALEAHGYVQMAQGLLHGEGPRLAEAARIWAAQHGYVVTEMKVPAPPEFKSPTLRP